MKFLVKIAILTLFIFTGCKEMPADDKSQQVSENFSLFHLFSAQSQLNLYVQGYDFEYYTVSVDLETDFTSFHCTLQNNPNWQTAKDLLLQNGVCTYSYDLNGLATCMAMPTPYGSLRDYHTGKTAELSTAMCASTHNSICGGAEKRKQFENAVASLSEELKNGTACQ